MSISIRQIHPVFVGEVSGIDIAKPLGATRWRRSRRGWIAMPCSCFPASR